MVFIGIDGGGSFSRLIAADENMRMIGQHEGKSTNIVSIGYDKVLENIKSLFAELNAVSGIALADCKSICIGTAGAGLPRNVRLIEQVFREAGYGGMLKVMTDGELVLAAETKGEPGLTVISGTGSIAYAADKQGNTFRCGGWGHMIDDDGSGYGIGISAIKHALMDVDGRGEKTMLTDMIIQHFNLDRIDSVLTYVYGTDFTKARIAELALLVKQACESDDTVAAQIQTRASAALVDLAAALIKKAELSNHKIILSGSVILLNDYIRDTFCETIHEAFPKMQIVHRGEAPEIGAAYLARTAFLQT